MSKAAKPAIRAGQEWEKREREPSPRRTRIRVLEVVAGLRGAPLRLTVATVLEGGRLVRTRELHPSALTNTPGGYMLVKDAPEVTP